MSEYFIYYSSINIVGAVVFFIMLMHDKMSIDRQEKMLKYDNALISFMLYCISDAIWSGVDSGVFPVNSFTVLATDFSYFVIMTAITYNWLRYVMSVEQIRNRNDRGVRISLMLPFAISVVVLVVTYIVAPGLLIDDKLKTRGLFDVFMVTIPYIYIIAVIVYAVKQALKEDNPVEKRKHLYIGFFPLMVVAGGLIQMIFMPKLPVFCFTSTILMLLFYIQAIEAQISTDPLTKLNNRGQLFRYISQESNLRVNGRLTSVMMMDINDFKMINDIFGHSEGDAALILVARALMSVVKKHNIPIFLGRYGGDEFVMIVHPLDEKELNGLVTEIRKSIKEKCLSNEKPYILSTGIGYDEYSQGEESIQACIARADEKLYKDKEECKKNGNTTLRREEQR
ncbi:MAG: GGDEF domain-containing protein [Lachnospiraceae bacterium]|nr:GGDEF domain-containing protein [Lachnospiraceae bacterium]